MKVFIGKNGVSGRVVNDKAAISHEFEKKTSLSKRSDGVISNRNIRTVGNKDVGTKEKKPPNIPSTTAQKQQHYIKSSPTRNSDKGHSVRNNLESAPIAPMPKNTALSDTNIVSSGTHTRSISKSADTRSVSDRAATQRISERSAARNIEGGNPTRSVSEGNSPKYSNGTSPRSSPKSSLQKAKNRSPQLAPNKKYKVLNNGVVGKNALTKKKIRVINNKIAAKLQKAKIKKLKKQQKKFMKEQSELIGIAMGGFAPAKKTDITKAATNVEKAVNIVEKPVDSLKRQFYSRADKSDDNGVKAAKLGMQISDYGTSAIKTAVNTGAKTVKNGAKITKRVYRRIHKPTSAELRRRLRKQLNHNLQAEAKFLAKRAIRNGSKAVGKAAANTAKAAAKVSAKAMTKATQAAARAAQAAAKAVVSTTAKSVGLIAETMPYSLIIIVVIVIILLIALMFGSFLSGVGGSVAGGGAWLVDDNSSQTPEEIYEGYKEFIEQAKDVMETQAKDALKCNVLDFCNGDTSVPRKLIQYVDKNHNATFYPAKGADSTINAFIEQFGSDDYADYMSLLFVLMTREKQQADGVTDAEIYDFDFNKSDFEEFMKTVNDNSCRWGDTFVYKTAVETSPHACPGQNCSYKTISGCHCAYYFDEDGDIHYYCGGHYYCPVDHTKLTVELFTVKDYYQKEYSEIYNFTENEKTRYEASKAIIQGLLNYWEG